MTSSIIRNSFLIALMAAAVVPTKSFASVQLPLNKDKRVSAPISSDSMNRIAFEKDRIAQVFGDEEAYTIQADEARGQIFLKPTVANGDKPIAITVSTELGVVQDMELLPQKIGTRTIILKDDKKKEEDQHKKSLNGFGPIPAGYMGSQSFGSSAFGHNSMVDAGGGDYAIQLVRLIKLSASQLFENSTTDEEPTPVTVSNLKVDGLKVFKQNGFVVSIYNITNTTDQAVDVTENAFSGRQVLAIASEKRTLSPKETSLLYIVQNA